jgi:hypothetical protein
MIARTTPPRSPTDVHTIHTKRTSRTTDSEFAPAAHVVQHHCCHRRERCEFDCARAYENADATLEE